MLPPELPSNTFARSTSVNHSSSTTKNSEKHNVPVFSLKDYQDQLIKEEEEKEKAKAARAPILMTKLSKNEGINGNIKNNNELISSILPAKEKFNFNSFIPALDDNNNPDDDDDELAALGEIGLKPTTSKRFDM